MDDLKALVAKWRSTAEKADFNAANAESVGLDRAAENGEARSRALRDCASELEAALSRPAGGEWPAPREARNSVIADDYMDGYTDGWNKCRAACLAAAPTPHGGEDARRLQEVLDRVPTQELNDWLNIDMEWYERAPTLDEFRVAIDAAIAASREVGA